MESNDYVHGYSDRERSRLRDQANTLAEILHHDTLYPAGSLVLEAGCGVGAQTIILAENSPGARITSVGHLAGLVEKARALAARSGVTNVTFQAADIFRLPFGDETFDHVFVCFVLEHRRAGRRAGCAETGAEDGRHDHRDRGDHGSCYFHPESTEARSHPVPDRPAERCGRELADRPGTVPRPGSGRLPRGPGLATMVYVDDSRRRWSKASRRTHLLPWSRACGDRRWQLA